MKIEVSNIDLQGESPIMKVKVVFRDPDTDPQAWAEVHVYLEKTDKPLSEIKEEAIQKAKAHLTVSLNPHD